MADEREEQDAGLRAAFKQVMAILPSPGTVEYWLRIEQASEDDPLPLEVLAHCLRAHLNEGARGDAERIFGVLLLRTQTHRQHWVRLIAGYSRDGTALGLAEDLEQEAALALWKELAVVTHTYLLVNFGHALKRIEQHVAHRFMQQAGQWKRAGVAQSRRVQRSSLDRLEGRAGTEEPMHDAESLADPTAEAAFNHVEISSDLIALLRSFHLRDRFIVYDRFWRGRTEAEIAAELRITSRTVRKILTRVLTALRARYQEEG